MIPTSWGMGEEIWTQTHKKTAAQLHPATNRHPRLDIDLATRHLSLQSKEMWRGAHRLPANSTRWCYKSRRGWTTSCLEWWSHKNILKSWVSSWVRLFQSCSSRFILGSLGSPLPLVFSIDNLRPESKHGWCCRAWRSSNFGPDSTHAPSPDNPMRAAVKQ